MSSQNSNRTVVIGDGWAALGAVSWLVQNGAETVWVPATGARLIPPLPALASGSGAEAWRRLAEGFGISVGEAQEGCFIREFRNKAFRAPAWMQAPTPEARAQVHEEVLGQAERAFAAPLETRFALTLGEIEERIRARLLGAENPIPGLTRIEGLPVAELRFEDDEVRAVVLGSGRVIECARVLYADAWSELTKIEGLPKGLPFTRRREPVGILQARFQHECPILPEAAPGELGFFSPLQREAGAEHESRVWGGFSSDGQHSTWTLILSPEQVEDNHEIAKKLRRMKSALDKMFVGAPWVSEGQENFMAGVRGEQVRFSERYLFSEGEPVSAPIALPARRGVQILTDGYGPARALEQVAALFGMETLRPQTEAENMNSPEASAT